MTNYLPVPSSNTLPSPFFTPDGTMKWKTVAFFLVLILALTVTVTVLTELVKPKNNISPSPAASAISDNSPTQPALPTPIPTTAQVVDPSWIKYLARQPGAFILYYPAGCRLSADSLKITCYGSLGDFFTLYPQSADRGIQAPPGWLSEVNLGRKDWERKMIENKHVATYTRVENGNHYVIAVEYQPSFSDKAQSLVESIVGTFTATAGTNPNTPSN